MTVLAKKNYVMKPCPRCDGNGHGVFASGTRWVCDYCDGAGKISKYPPPPNLWAGLKPRNENGWTA